MVTATGIDQNGTKTTNFAEVQEVKENGMALKISTRNNTQLQVYYHRYDEQGRLISIADSSSTLQSTTSYQYGADGRIIQIKNVIIDAGNDFNQTEIHQWIYDASWQSIKNVEDH